MEATAGLRWELDSNGIVTLTIDDPNQPVNTMNSWYRNAMSASIERLTTEIDSVTGVVLASAKSTFFAGGDLRELVSIQPRQATEFNALIVGITSDLRRLERLGKPVVAALNGSALGGGLEIALACHHRIAVGGTSAQFGFPEVTLGLLPGAGGIVRSVRLLGLQPALDILLDGTRISAEQAKARGLIDEVVSGPEQLLVHAKAWILANPASAQPWDRPGFALPGGLPPGDSLALVPAQLRLKVRSSHFDAPRSILSAAVEGAQVDTDSAARIEREYFVDLVVGRTSKNMIKGLFFDTQTIRGGGSRPQEPARWRASKALIVGAGLMGAGIAYQTAVNGVPVVLTDVSADAAEKGKAYSAKVLKRRVDRGEISQDVADEILARITASDSIEAAADADIVIEAVFENQELKKKIFGDVERVLAPDAVLASNTSSLPITDLAAAVSAPDRFIGLHFFSPVDKMNLVEIVVGAKTSDETLARAFDFAQQIRRTPIVVSDSRGFFTSRVFAAMVNEGLAMLGEGVNPSTIERAFTEAGFPVPVLQLCDELNLELLQHIRDEGRAAAAAAGETYADHAGEAVFDKMVELGRPGRLHGAGFYDYDLDGRRLGLWSGLNDAFGAAVDSPVPYLDVQERLLFAESLESVRCLEEGVLRLVADANVGSMFGIGYPRWTGGVLQYLNGYEGGLKGAVVRCEELAAMYGARFEPPSLLLSKAGRGETFE